MGSVIDCVRCPQCGGEYIRDYYYRTSEEYCSCARCGKMYEISLIRDDNDDPVLDEQGKPRYTEKSQKGYGAAGFFGKKGGGTILSFNDPVDDEIKSGYLRTLEMNPDMDKSKSYLTAWDEEKQEVVAVFGEVPPLYSEEDS